MASHDSAHSATESTGLLRPRAVSRATSDSVAPLSNSPQDGTEQEPRISPLRASLLILAFMILIFLQSANFTLMSTVQGRVAGDLDAYADVSWFTSAYMIGMSCMSPVYGRLSQIFSPRYCVLWASIVFTLGAFTASQAQALTVFLLGRAIQGIGAAGILTLSIILVIQLTNKKQRGLFIGLANSGVTAGVSLGAVVGGAGASSAGWRPLLWMQCPLAIVCGMTVFLSVPEPEHDVHFPEDETFAKRLWTIDYTGVALLVLSLVSLLYGLSHPVLQVIPMVIGMVILVLFVLHEMYRAKSPIIPISVFKSRGALLSCFGQMGFMSVRWAVLFYAPIYGQAVRLWGPAQAGTLLIPTNVGFAAGGLLVGIFHIRRTGSFWLPCVICYTLFPITVFVLSQISDENSDSGLYIFTLIANGLFVGAGLNYCLAHMLHLTTPDTHFVVTSLLATFRGFSGSFGSAVGGGLFLRLLSSSLQAGFEKRGLLDKRVLQERLLGDPALVRQLKGVDQQVARQGYKDAISGLFLAGVGLAALSIFVQAATGWRSPDPLEPSADRGEEEEEE